MKGKRTTTAKIPAAVLERAKAAAQAGQEKPQKDKAPAAARPSAPRTRGQATRAKVVAALKKLHPMD